MCRGYLAIGRQVRRLNVFVCLERLMYYVILPFISIKRTEENVCIEMLGVGIINKVKNHAYEQVPIL